MCSVFEDLIRPHIRSIRLKQGELIASLGVSGVAYAKVLLTRYKALGHEDGRTSLVELRAKTMEDLAVIESHLLVIEQTGGIRHGFWKEGAATHARYVHLVDGITDMLEWAGQRKLKNSETLRCVRDGIPGPLPDRRGRTTMEALCSPPTSCESTVPILVARD